MTFKVLLFAEDQDKLQTFIEYEIQADNAEEAVERAKRELKPFFNIKDELGAGKWITQI